MSSVLLCVFPAMLFPNNAISGIQKSFSQTLKVVCVVVGDVVKICKYCMTCQGSGGNLKNVDHPTCTRHCILGFTYVLLLFKSSQ